MKLPQRLTLPGIGFSPSSQSRWSARLLGAEQAELAGRANEAGFTSGRKIQQVSCRSVKCRVKTG
jgi:hypothetical protein